MIDIVEKARAALEKQQESFAYKYSELEKSIWINGYVQGAIERAEKELKELQK